MNNTNTLVIELKGALKELSSSEKAESSRRYFPDGIHCIGVNAADIKLVIKDFHVGNPQLTPEQVLFVTEELLNQAEYSEEVLVAFGLINKFVKRHYDHSLLARFEYWLEHYATNWSHVDDLCIKTVYQFLLSRPELIEATQHWAHSDVAWCRRASNVVWVKFIKRRVGKSTYYLNKELVFKNCDLLQSDDDEFVQKSVGWLLKVTAAEHHDAVIDFLTRNAGSIQRLTLRYAIEKMDANTRRDMLAL